MAHGEESRRNPGGRHAPRWSLVLLAAAASLICGALLARAIRGRIAGPVSASGLSQTVLCWNGHLREESLVEVSKNGDAAVQVTWRLPPGQAASSPRAAK